MSPSFRLDAHRPAAPVPEREQVAPLDGDPTARPVPNHARAFLPVGMRETAREQHHKPMDFRDTLPCLATVGHIGTRRQLAFAIRTRARTDRMNLAAVRNEEDMQRPRDQSRCS